MKKRTFYIVNLDKNRIMLLSVLLTGFILLAFATGYRFGHVPGESPQSKRTDAGFSGSLKGKSTAGGMAADKTAGSTGSPNASGDDSRYGSSIYDLKKGSGRTQTENKKSERVAGNSLRRDDGYQSDINGSISMKNNRERMNRADGRTSHRRDIARKKRRDRELARRESRREARRKRQEAVRKEAARRKAERRKKIAARREAEKLRLKRAKERRLARLNRNRRRGDAGDRRTALLRTRGDRSRSFRNTAPGGSSSETRKRSRRSYTVQVGAYRMKRSATRIASTLKSKGFGARVRRHRGHYFVMVGSASSKNELRGLRQRLRREKYPSFIIPAK